MKFLSAMILLGVTLSTQVLATEYRSLLRSKEIKVLIEEVEDRPSSAFENVADKIADHVRYLHEAYLPAQVIAKLKDHPVTVILEKVKATDGRYWPPGTHPNFKPKDGPLISLTPDNFNTADWRRLLTHEYFHHVHQLYSPSEASWVREGLAQYFEYKVHGVFNPDNTMAAISETTVSLVEEFDIAAPSPELYGNAFLYFHHFFNNCGEGLFWRLLQERKDTTGVALIDHVLKGNRCKSFDAQSEKYMMARAYNRSNVSGWSDTLFLFPTLVRAKPNKYFEATFGGLPEESKLEFGKALPPYLSVLMTSKGFKTLFSAEMVKAFRKEKVKFFLFETHFPYRATFFDEVAPFDGRVLIFKTNGR